MALTELAVKKLGKKSKRYEIHDGNGLYLRVFPSGKKAWVYRYQFEGRPRAFDNRTMAGDRRCKGTAGTRTGLTATSKRR